MLNLNNQLHMKITSFLWMQGHKMAFEMNNVMWRKTLQQ